MNNIKLEKLQHEFQQIYDKKSDRIFFSPGRVNLIGEHTDYNGGHVFPCAITQGTYGLVTAHPENVINCYSMNFSELGVISFRLDDIEYKEEDKWVNYVKGVIKYLKNMGHKINGGFDLLIYGDIPNGAGLSSSASLELLIGVIAENLFNLDVERIDLIKIGQQVENEFIGVNSGIMDQFAVGMGEKNQAIFLDVNTLDYQLVPAEFGDYVILIMNTNKRRELADSKYNQRRRECEEALERLQVELQIDSLGDLTNEKFEENRKLIKDSILESRAKHAVYENTRTVEAKALLSENNLKQFGNLLNESHISLRDDYDVTGIELDTLVEAAWDQKHVLGARMTGAGMGGCAIALVEKNNIDIVTESVKDKYVKTIGYEPSFYVAEVGDGAKELVLK